MSIPPPSMWVTGIGVCYNRPPCGREMSANCCRLTLTSSLAAPHMQEVVAVDSLPSSDIPVTQPISGLTTDQACATANVEWLLLCIVSPNHARLPIMFHPSRRLRPRRLHLPTPRPLLLRQWTDLRYLQAPSKSHPHAPSVARPHIQMPRTT